MAIVCDLATHCAPKICSPHVAKLMLCCLDLRAYQLQMTKDLVSATTFNVRIISLRFFLSGTADGISRPTARLSHSGAVFLRRN